MLSFSVLNESEYFKWDDYLSENFPNNVFSLSKWIVASSIVEGSLPHIFAVLFNGHIIGGVAGTIKKRFGIRILEPPLFTPYNGISISQNLPETVDCNEAISFLINGIKGRADRLIISCYPETILNSNSPGINYKYTKRYTNIISFKDDSDIKSKFKRDIKRNIKKAERLNIQIVEEYNPEIFYNLLMKVIEKSRLNIKINLNSFTRMLDTINELQILRMTFGKTNGSYSGGRILIHHNKIGFSWLSATDPEYYRTGITQSLRYHEMQRLVDDDYRLYDFVGINIPGIRRQKRAFGGEKAAYKVFDLTFGLKAKSYKYLQNIFRK
ncbi:MAG: GNAT family N-acetyltransferase [candidate division Zixibacteria bacterium]|nr:GNAT family N-acetyltransferase [candidate division Zixibacteria bacterium]